MAPVGCSSPTLHGCKQTGSLVGLAILNTHLFLMWPNQFQSPLVFWSLARYAFQPHDILPWVLPCWDLLFSNLLFESECSFGRALLWEDCSSLTRREWFSTLPLTTLPLDAVWMRLWGPFRYVPFFVVLHNCITNRTLLWTWEMRSSSVAVTGT